MIGNQGRTGADEGAEKYGEPSAGPILTAGGDNVAAEALLSILESLVPTRYLGLYGVRPGGGLELLASTGVSGAEALAMAQSAKMGPVNAALEGRLIHFPRFDGRLHGLPTQHPAIPTCRTLVAQPMLHDQEVLGVLEIGADRENVYGKAELRTIERLATLGAVALNRTRGLPEPESCRQQFELGRHLALWYWDVTAGQLWYSPALYRMLQFLPPELEMDVPGWERLIHPGDRDSVQASIKQYLRGHVSQTALRYRVLTGSAQWKRIVHYLAPIQNDRTGNRVMCGSVVLDWDGEHAAEEEARNAASGARARELALEADNGHLSRALEIEVEERRCAQERAEVYRRKLRQTTETLLLAEEAQRRMYAQQLEEGVGSELDLLGARVKRLLEVPSDRSDDSLERLCSQLGRLRDRARTLAEGLSPAASNGGGVTKALGALLERLAREHSVQTEFICDVPLNPISEDMHVLIYGAVQELLTHAVAHSQANQVRLTCSQEVGTVRIDVEDNGAGPTNPLVTDQLGRTGYGFALFAVKERLQNMGGQLSLSPRAEGGSLVRMIVPTVSK